MLYPLLITLGLSVCFVCSLPLWIDRYEVWKKFGYSDYGYNEKNGIHFLFLKSLAMFDWDLPDEGHKTDKCITIQEREEVLEILSSFCKENPSYLFYVEKTVGGVRAWEVSQPRFPRKTTPLMSSLNVDPLYVSLVSRFGCRVSPKPNRVNEKIEFWCSIGSGTFNPKLKVQWDVYCSSLQEHNLA